MFPRCYIGLYTINPSVSSQRRSAVQSVPLRQCQGRHVGIAYLPHRANEYVAYNLFRVATSATRLLHCYHNPSVSSQRRSAVQSAPLRQCQGRHVGIAYLPHRANEDVISLTISSVPPLVLLGYCIVITTRAIRTTNDDRLSSPTLPAHNERISGTGQTPETRIPAPLHPSIPICAFVPLNKKERKAFGEITAAMFQIVPGQATPQIRNLKGENEGGRTVFTE
ncbi:hypothetical protein J6590_010027 [Homalodisca vitripennis]|nr:hypothetical protein J6590_010027 [Homalodisca vitripennis]